MALKLKSLWAALFSYWSLSTASVELEAGFLEASILDIIKTRTPGAGAGTVGCGAPPRGIADAECVASLLRRVYARRCLAGAQLRPIGWLLLGA